MRVIHLFVLFWLLEAITGCAVNPVTGKNELSWISESDEIAMGNQQYLPSQQSQGGLFLADPEIIRYVNEVGQRMARAGDRALPYEFVVLNSSVPNAWALPGGKIAINRGLLLALDNEAELAAVLGHETVHSAAKHGANAIQRNQVFQGLVLATELGSSQSEFSNAIVGGARLGAQLITQKYGRNAELEADYYGIKYMIRAGYDARAAISLQQTFVKLSAKQATNQFANLFDSHPASESRVQANRVTVAELSLPGAAEGQRFRARYRQKMMFLKKTKQAYDDFDRAMKLSSDNQLGPARLAIAQAMTIVPTEARFLGLQGNIFYQQQEYSAARDSYDRAVALDDNYYEYYLGRGLANSRQGNSEAAKEDLRRSNALLPTAIANHTLGQLSLAEGDSNTAKSYYRVAMDARGKIGDDARVAFARLDLPDNPARYILVKTGFDPRNFLIASVQNSTDFVIKDVSIRFSAHINQQSVSRVVRLKILGPKQQFQITSGWQLSPEDVIDHLDVRVIEAAAHQRSF